MEFGLLLPEGPRKYEESIRDATHNIAGDTTAKKIA